MNESRPTPSLPPVSRAYTFIMSVLGVLPAAALVMNPAAMLWVKHSLPLEQHRGTLMDLAEFAGIAALLLTPVYCLVWSVILIRKIRGSREALVVSGILSTIGMSVLNYIIAGVGCALVGAMK